MMLSRVERYNKDGVFINRYLNIEEAARQTGIHADKIERTCEGTYNTANGDIYLTHMSINKREREIQSRLQVLKRPHTRPALRAFISRSKYEFIYVAITSLYGESRTEVTYRIDKRHWLSELIEGEWVKVSRRLQDRIYYTLGLGHILENHMVNYICIIDTSTDEEEGSIQDHVLMSRSDKGEIYQYKDARCIPLDMAVDSNEVDSYVNALENGIDEIVNLLKRSKP